MTPRDAIPFDWTRRLQHGPIGLGLDLGITDKGTSNPSSLTVTEQVGRYYFERLVITWKTSDDRITKAMLRCVCEDIQAAKRKPRGIGIDASSEKFLCAQIEREFHGYGPVRLIAGNQVLEYKGEEMQAKIMLGNLYANAYADALMGMPDEAFISYDRRLVQRDNGTFKAALGENGEHGDTFDSGKLAFWCLKRGGRAEASGASITPTGSAGIASQLKNWVAKRAGLRLPGTRRRIGS